MNINRIPGLSPRALEQTRPRGVKRTREAIEEVPCQPTHHIRRARTTGSAALEPSDYARLYEASSWDPERFWSEHGRRLEWIKPYSRVRDISYGPGEVHIR